jgi:hypothetical protein
LDPYIQEAVMAPEYPDIQILDINWYRILFYERYVKKTTNISSALDITLLPHDRLLFSDASDSQNPKITRPLPNLQNLWNDLIKDKSQHFTQVMKKSQNNQPTQNVFLTNASSNQAKIAEFIELLRK